MGPSNGIQPSFDGIEKLGKRRIGSKLHVLHWLHELRAVPQMIAGADGVGV